MQTQQLDGRTVLVVDPEDSADAERIARDIPGLSPESVQSALRSVVREGR